MKPRSPGFCIGTERRACGTRVEKAGGRIRCDGCRRDQRDLVQRRRNTIANAKRRTR